MQVVFTRKNKGLSRLYDRKFTSSYTSSPQPITLHVVTYACQIVFGKHFPDACLVAHYSFEMADEFSEFNCNTLPFRFTIPLSHIVLCFRRFRLFWCWIDRITTLRRILELPFCRDINRILRKKLLLFRRNIARINTREVIKYASSPAIFSKMHAFVI